ncbi:MAG: sugar ABC transporter ATP-binding protein [Spirochaetes bacterium]|nr:sugar ABC transporter ATP-binding protein [Spirochaetota bacterium]
MDKPILKMENISKSFPGVKALENVQLDLYKGKVIALLGENGAGKSTLMKILSGVYKKDSGTITYKEKKLELHNPKDAQEKGISIIHQELNLIHYLSVAENIFLGREFCKKYTGNIDWTKLYTEAKKYLDLLDMDINPKKLVNQLSISEQQMIEIAKALSFESEVIIMDEPTAAITKQETETLFKIIEKLKESNKAIIYISHKLDEVFRISDFITVLRDGKYIGTVKTDQTSQTELLQMMVGRKIEDIYIRNIVNKGDEILRVENLTKKGLLNNINFQLNRGEVLGISGLMGAGRTEMAKTIFGSIKKDGGAIYIHGQKTIINSPIDAVKAGIAYASEDRKSEGLFLGLSVKFNITISSLKKILKRGMISNKSEKSEVDKYIQQFNIKTPSAVQKIKNLSGGNQQKVVISKWLLSNPQVLILDEPTRGIDVGAKIEIYQLMNDLKEQGVAIIFISSEMPELLGVSDRILVMHNGSITGEFTHGEATQEKLSRCAFGLT